ncbi:hypothetical protein FBU30_004384 [Linnemannia zychae]|nr:hypothetical protein FBU30_004384 [Linnemannia zychae]
MLAVKSTPSPADRQLDPKLRTDLAKTTFVIAHTYVAEATRDAQVGHAPSAAFFDNMGLIFQPQPIIQKTIDETKVLGPKVIVAVNSLVNRVKKINGGLQILENLYTGIRLVEEEAKKPGSTAASVLRNHSLDEIQDGTKKKRRRPAGTQLERVCNKKKKPKFKATTKALKCKKERLKDNDEMENALAELYLS